jgi:hypothetical protein
MYVIQGLIHSGLYMQDCAIYKSGTTITARFIYVYRVGTYNNPSDRIYKSTQPRFLLPVIYHESPILLLLRHLPPPRPLCLSACQEDSTLGNLSVSIQSRIQGATSTEIAPHLSFPSLSPSPPPPTPPCIAQKSHRI